MDASICCDLYYDMVVSTTFIIVTLIAMIIWFGYLLRGQEKEKKK